MNLRKIFFILFLLFFAGYNSLSAKNNYERFWVQYSEDDSILFRFLTDNQKSSCPNIFVDDKKTQTFERKHDYKKEFPIKICQAVLKNDQNDHLIEFKANKIKISGNLKKISSIGDTGCTIKMNKFTGKLYEQNCLDTNEYPFEINTKNIKNYEKPDLIVHLGDYYYTEAECQDKSKCGGRSFGDNFLTWRADFLDSGINLFETAPMIFARGNHEKCDRGGKGWAVLFDNSINFKKCSEFDKSFSVNFKNINFFMVDSSSPNDIKKIKTKEDEERIKFYSYEFEKILSKTDLKKINVLITHRPVFASNLRFDNYEKNAKNKNYNKYLSLNLILGEAFLEASSKQKNNLDFILSGHLHKAAKINVKNFNVKNSGKKLNISQIICGNGGAHLIKHDFSDKKSFSMYEESNRVTLEREFKAFGYSNIFFDQDKKKKAIIEFINLENKKN